MKKLLVILLTLLMVAALPLCIMAEEVTTAADTAAVGGVDSSELVTEIETVVLPYEEATEFETEAETEYKMNLGFHIGTLSETLPVMGMGMLGIFVVTCVIVLAVLVLSRFGGKSDEE